VRRRVRRFAAARQAGPARDVLRAPGLGQRRPPRSPGRARRDADAAAANRRGAPRSEGLPLCGASPMTKPGPRQVWERRTPISGYAPRARRDALPFPALRSRTRKRDLAQRRKGAEKERRAADKDKPGARRNRTPASAGAALWSVGLRPAGLTRPTAPAQIGAARRVRHAGTAVADQDKPGARRNQTAASAGAALATVRLRPEGTAGCAALSRPTFSHPKKRSRAETQRRRAGAPRSRQRQARCAS
jgi:hypothetical protein